MTRSSRAWVRTSAGVALLTLCGCAPSRSAPPTPAGTDHSSLASPATATSASIASGRAATNASGGGASAASSDPCALFTPADAKAVLGADVGQARKTTGAGTTVCSYSDPLIVIAILQGSFNRGSFQNLISSQDNGPYGSTAGKGVGVAGLGDAADSYAAGTIVEALEGSAVVSITTEDAATSRKVTRAVLAQLP